MLFRSAAAAVVSFGTHLLTAQSSAAPWERRLRLRLAVDNLLLVSSVGKVQQGSSLSWAATSSIPRSVADPEACIRFFWSPWANRRQILPAPDLVGGTRGRRGSFSWGVSVGRGSGQVSFQGARMAVRQNFLAIELLLHLRVKMCRKMNQRPPQHRHINIVLAPLIFFLSESLNPSEELKSK